MPLMTRLIAKYRGTGVSLTLINNPYHGLIWHIETFSNGDINKHCFILQKPIDDDNLWEDIEWLDEDYEFERFKKPSAKEIIGYAILFNDGNLDEDTLSKMVGMSDLLIDRLYENGDCTIPTIQEIVTS